MSDNSSQNQKTIPLTELDNTLPINSFHNEDQAKDLSVALKGGHKTHGGYRGRYSGNGRREQNAPYEHQMTLNEHQKAAPNEHHLHDPEKYCMVARSKAMITKNA